MSSAARIVIVDDEADLAASCQRLLDGKGYRTAVAHSGEEGLEAVRLDRSDLVLTDLKMPGMGGMELLKQVKSESPETAVVMMTAFCTIEDAVEAMQLGAADFIPKPFTPDHLAIVVERVLEGSDLRRENRSLREQLGREYSFDNIIGRSAPMVQIFESIKKIADSNINVLITGASGTGKELIARSIHTNSHRHGKPFVPINCGALPENLVESEIFGYEKGAFTGAAKSRPGLLEEADGGTFFMDEVGELPHVLQVKFLRALEDGRFRRLGSNEERGSDFRLICATNQNLDHAVDEGDFREDLFYRINTFPIHLPPLKQRRDDIVLLAAHYMQVFARKNQRPVVAIEDPAMALMTAHEWRGNVRELQNVLERALILAGGESISVDDLPEALKGSRDRDGDTQVEFYLDFPFKDAKERVIEDFERRYITEVLKNFKGNVSRSAEHSGIDRRSLHRLLSKYHIDAHEAKR